MIAWDWSSFRGSRMALLYNQRDLPHLDRAVTLAPARRAAVQAGGHLGVYPKRLAESFDTVYTFEPDSELFAHLMHNAPESNIVKLQAALGDARRLVGVVRARRDGSAKPVHEGLTHISGDGVIPTLRVDDLGLKWCDLLCLDLEGWELYAIRGAQETIHRCRPVIMVEINQNQRFEGIHPEFLRDCIKALGYRYHETLASDEVYVPAEWALKGAA